MHEIARRLFDDNRTQWIPLQKYNKPDVSFKEICTVYVNTSIRFMKRKLFDPIKRITSAIQKKMQRITEVIQVEWIFG